MGPHRQRCVRRTTVSRRNSGEGLLASANKIAYNVALRGVVSSLNLLADPLGLLGGNRVTFFISTLVRVYCPVDCSHLQSVLITPEGECMEPLFAAQGGNSSASKLVGRRARRRRHDSKLDSMHSPRRSDFASSRGNPPENRSCMMNGSARSSPR